jgi:hypothetical protein
MRYGFAALPGASPVVSKALERLLELDAGATLLGTEYVVVADGLVEPGVFPVVAKDAAMGASVMRARGPRPRAFVAPRWIRAADPIEILHEPTAAGDPGFVVLDNPGDPPPPASVGELPGTCEVSSRRPERVELVCDSRIGGYATLLDAHAAGWTATVDGVEARVEKADAVFRAVRVEAGAHRVVFQYKTPWLRAGAAIALLSWAMWLAIVALAIRRTDGEVR